MGAEEFPEAVDLRRERERVREDGGGPLHIAFVYRDADLRRVGEAQRFRGPGPHVRLKAGVRLLDGEQHVRAGDPPIREPVGDAAELVEADRRLAHGRVAGQRVPQPALDVGDSGAVVAALREVRECPGQLIERALGPGGVRAGDDEGRFGPEGRRDHLDEPFAGGERTRIDLRAVGELPGQGVVHPGQDQRGPGGSPLDRRGRLDKRHRDPGRFESEPSGQVGQAVDAPLAGGEHRVHAVREHPAAEQPLRGVEVGEVHVVLAAAARPARDRARGIRRRPPGNPDRGTARQPRLHRLEPRVRQARPGSLRVGRLVPRLFRLTGVGGLVARGKSAEEFRGRAQLRFIDLDLGDHASHAGLSRPDSRLREAHGRVRHAPGLQRLGEIVPDAAQLRGRKRSRMRQDAGKQSGRRLQSLVVPADHEHPGAPVLLAHRHGPFSRVEGGGVDTRRTQAGDCESVPSHDDPDPAALGMPGQRQVHRHRLESQPGGDLGARRLDDRRRIVPEHERRVYEIGYAVAVRIEHERPQIEQRGEIGRLLGGERAGGGRRRDRDRQRQRDREGSCAGLHHVPSFGGATFTSFASTPTPSTSTSTRSPGESVEVFPGVPV